LVVDTHSKKETIICMTQLIVLSAPTNDLRYLRTTKPILHQYSRKTEHIGF